MVLEPGRAVGGSPTRTGNPPQTFLRVDKIPNIGYTALNILAKYAETFPY